MSEFLAEEEEHGMGTCLSGTTYSDGLMSQMKEVAKQSLLLAAHDILANVCMPAS